MIQYGDIILNELRAEKRGRDILTEKYNTALAWIRAVNKGRSFRSMVEKKGFENVIIYGLDELGMRTIEACIREDITIAAVSDVNIKEGGYEFWGSPMVPIKDLISYQHEGTGIIVAAVGHFEEIKRDLGSLGLCNILSLRELIG